MRRQVLAAVLLVAGAQAAEMGAAGGRGRIAAANCEKVIASQTAYVGSVDWQDQADGTIVGSSEAKSAAVVMLVCVARLPAPAQEVVLDFGGAYVSFSGAAGQPRGSGLLVSVFGDTHRGSSLRHSSLEPACSLSGTRIAGEDWLELGRSAYRVPFEKPVQSVTIVLKLVDASAGDPLRIDVKPFRIRQAKRDESLTACPPASQVQLRE